MVIVATFPHVEDEKSLLHSKKFNEVFNLFRPFVLVMPGAGTEGKVLENIIWTLVRYLFCVVWLSSVNLAFGKFTPLIRWH